MSVVAAGAANIAVLCAAHGGNSGMYSVDLAAHEFFSELGLKHRLFVAQQNPGEDIDFGELKYSLLSSLNDLRDYTHLVYWGDFINNPAYGFADFSRRDVKFGHSATRAEAFNRWKGIFSGVARYEYLRAISVGNNFQHDLQRKGGEFGRCIKTLFSGCGAIYPRDPFSLKNIAKYAEYCDLEKLQQGMDCAFLQSARLAQAKQPQFSYMFFRSGIQEPMKLVQEIELATGLKGVPLKNWLSLDRKTAEVSFRLSREEIARSRFVVSDTYHVCINSMNLEVPLICLGRKHESQHGTLGDFKKKILFEMMGLSEFYIIIPDGDDSDGQRQRLAGQVREKLISASGTGVFELKRLLVEDFKRKLRGALFEAR